MYAMFVYVNDQKCDLEKMVNLNFLFTTLNIEVTKGIAVAVNNRVISKSEWNSYTLTTGDKIILIKATQGG